MEAVVDSTPVAPAERNFSALSEQIAFLTNSEPQNVPTFSECFATHAYISSLDGSDLKPLLAALAKAPRNFEYFELLADEAIGVGDESLTCSRRALIKEIMVLSEIESGLSTEDVVATWHEFLRPVISSDIKEFDGTNLAALALLVTLIASESSWASAYERHISQEISDCVKIPELKERIDRAGAQLSHEPKTQQLLERARRESYEEDGTIKIRETQVRPLQLALEEFNTRVLSALNLPENTIRGLTHHALSSAVQFTSSLLLRRAAIVSAVTELFTKLPLSDFEFNQHIQSQFTADRPTWSGIMFSFSERAGAHSISDMDLDRGAIERALRGVVPEAQLKQILLPGSEGDLLSTLVAILPAFERQEEAMRVVTRLSKQLASYALIAEGREVLNSHIEGRTENAYKRWSESILAATSAVRESLEKPDYDNRPAIHTPEGLLVQVKDLQHLFAGAYVWSRDAGRISKELSSHDLAKRLPASTFVPEFAALVDACVRCVKMSERTQVTERATIMALHGHLAKLIEAGRQGVPQLDIPDGLAEGKWQRTANKKKITPDVRIMVSSADSQPSVSGVSAALDFIVRESKPGQVLMHQEEIHTQEGRAAVCVRALLSAIAEPTSRTLALEEQIFDTNSESERDFARLVWALSLTGEVEDQVTITTAVLSLAKDQADLLEILADPKDLISFVSYKVLRDRVKLDASVNAADELYKVLDAWASSLRLIAGKTEGLPPSARVVEAVADSIYVSGYETLAAAERQEINTQGYWERISNDWILDDTQSDQVAERVWQRQRVIQEQDLPHIDTPEGIVYRFDQALMSSEQLPVSLVDVCRALTYPQHIREMATNIPADMLVPRLLRLQSMAVVPGQEVLAESLEQALSQFTLHSQDGIPHWPPARAISEEGIAVYASRSSFAIENRGFSADALSLLITRLDTLQKRQNDTDSRQEFTLVSRVVAENIVKTNFERQLSLRQNLPMNALFTLWSASVTLQGGTKAEAEAGTDLMRGMLRILAEVPEYEGAFQHFWDNSIENPKVLVIERLCQSRSDDLRYSTKMRSILVDSLVCLAANDLHNQVPTLNSIGNRLLTTLIKVPGIVDQIGNIASDSKRSDQERSFATAFLVKWAPEIAALDCEEKQQFSDATRLLVFRRLNLETAEALQIPPSFEIAPNGALFGDFYRGSEVLSEAMLAKISQYKLLKDFAKGIKAIDTQDSADQGIEAINVLSKRIISRVIRHELQRAARVKIFNELVNPEIFVVFTLDAIEKISALPAPFEQSGKDDTLKNLRHLLGIAAQYGAPSRHQPSTSGDSVLGTAIEESAATEFYSGFELLAILPGYSPSIFAADVAVKALAAVSEKILDEPQILEWSRVKSNMLEESLFLLASWPTLNDAERAKIGLLVQHVHFQRQGTIVDFKNLHNRLHMGDLEFTGLMKQWDNAFHQDPKLGFTAEAIGQRRALVDRTAKGIALSSFKNLVRIALDSTRGRYAEYSRQILFEVLDNPRAVEVLSCIARNGSANEREFLIDLLAKGEKSIPSLRTSATATTQRLLLEMEKGAERTAFRSKYRAERASTSITFGELELRDALKALAGRMQVVSSVGSSAV